MKRILLIQPGLEGPGGGDGVAAWMAQALCRDYDLTIFSWDSVDPDAVDRYFGTNLSQAKIEWHHASTARRRWVDAIPFRHGLLRASLLLRWARELGPFDLRISALCEASLGEPGLQYVHIPWTVHPWSDVSFLWYSPALSWLRVLYEKLCSLLAKNDRAGIEANRTLVNSHWTARLWSSQYSMAPHVLYPPALSGERVGDWTSRKNGFLCIGRMAEDKRVEMMIEIIERVREHHPDIELQIVGSPDSEQYASKIRDMTRHRSWLTLHEQLDRDQLSKLMAETRYGIHGKAEEHFGMAVAEMVGTGCLVFVPNGGGQIEIVGERDELCYDNVEDAVVKIRNALESSALQQELRDFLQVQGEIFSSEAFLSNLRCVVEELTA